MDQLDLDVDGLAVTIGFRDTSHISNASGLAVITVMLVTTCLMFLVIILCWHKNAFLAIIFILFFGSIEVLYFSSSLMKFREGAWVPIVLSLFFLAIMYSWHYGTMKKYEFDVQNKVSVQWILGLGAKLGIVRVQGIGLIHTELVSGIPAIFTHFVTNLPAFHQVVVFLCIKSVPVPHVRPEERFLVGRIGPRKHRIYRCIARYGYRDIHLDDVQFEKELFCSIAELIRSEAPENDTKNEDYGDHEKLTVIGTPSTRGIRLCEYDEDASEITSVDEMKEMGSPTAHEGGTGLRKRVRFVLPGGAEIDPSAREELKQLTEVREAGMAFILGHCDVRAKSGSSFIKRLGLNVCYDFLRRNSRGPTYAISFPRASTLEVGMIYHV